MYNLAIGINYFLKEISCQCSGWFCNNIYMLSNNFCSRALYYSPYNDIWYRANNHKQFFCYLLFSMKQLYQIPSAKSA